MQSVFSQLALFLLVCIKNKDCFNGAVQTHWAAFVQCNIFFLFLTRTHATHTNRGVGGGLVQSVRTYGLICYSLLDRRKTEGEKVLIFCQYGCVLILGPHSFSSLRCGGGGGGVSHLFCQFPWQRGSSKSEEVRPLVRGESGFTEINIT